MRALALFRKDITLDKISERIDQSKDAPKNYEEHGENVDVDSDEFEDGSHGSSLNATMLITAFAIFLTVGFGTYFFVGGDIQIPQFSMSDEKNDFTSAADANCKQSWILNKRNDKALNCYLTTNLKRLCRSEERSHLSAIINNYRNEDNTYRSGLNANILSTKLQNIVDYAKLGMGKLMIEVEAAKDANGEIDWKKHSDLAKRIKAARESFQSGNYRANSDRDTAGPVVAQHQANAESKNADIVLTQSIRNLAELGYMQESDFGWFPDPIVKEAFRNYRETKTNPCSG